MSMVVVLVIVIVVALAVWYSISQSNQGSNQENMAFTYQKISPQEYQTGYAQRNHLLVDVRTAEEFRSGHIPKAVNIALQNLPQQMATLPKDQPIVVYCRSGARSNSAAQMLAKAGFENVQDLGGIMQWQAQGLSIKQ
jgi:phage shock protein E